MRAFYESRRRDDEYEPAWTHPLFLPAFSGETPNKETVREMRSYLASIAKSPHIVTRMLGMKHVQEDGFLIGTTSWVFMGRALSSPVRYRGWTIINRALSTQVTDMERANQLGSGQPTLFFLAYNDAHAVGASAMTGDEIGPCTSLAEVKAYIDHMAADEPPTERQSDNTTRALVLEPMTIGQWPKQQADLRAGDHGLVVTGYDDELGMLPGWVRVLSRDGDMLRVLLLAPGPIGTPTEGPATLAITRVLPLSSSEFAASAPLAAQWRDPWSLSPTQVHLNLRIGAYFDRGADGDYHAREYDLRPTEVSVVGVPSPHRAPRRGGTP
jgi:hypothetical protein